jgi:hypothetical protein
VACLERSRLQLSLGRPAQRFYFIAVQFAHLARFQIEHQRAIPHPANFLHVMADLLEHLAQLAIAAFDQHHFVPRIVALPHLTDPRRCGAHLALAQAAALN